MENIRTAIVGGGPAGLQAAISLSRAGMTPTVFEEHSSIGQPIQCGEGLSIQAFDDFSIPIEESKLWINLHKKCKLVFPENRATYGDTQAYMIRRDKFDQYLAKKAINLGAEIITATKVHSIQQNPEGVILNIKGDETKRIQSDLVILAEGARAKLAQRLNFVPPSPLIYGFEYKIEGEWGKELEFHFDSEKYPYGYVWIFPRKNETNIGIVTTAKERKKRLDNFLKQNNITGKILKKMGGPIPMKGPIPKLYRDNVLVVGDTAGMVNPIFYGGIRMGMTSGEIAGKIGAKFLTSKEENQFYSLSNYQSEILKFKFMDEINLKCHNFFYSRSNKFLSKLGKILNDQYINRISGREKIKVFSNLIKEPGLLRHPKGLLQIYKGFKIARDWGF
ncbi:MAG: NAD(P)/FAD-dependent oxidoreductase [Candidatus Heimdallarchaeota archaeon]|nr:NAD(P)/FAD-dependent oxidoreductase [Candidatus Heimdallarchaeota archaeon]MCG3254465.1 NAD(P)/FAD-dependent oxidoreductase [Candidatus Heimdallarchaeota archaeon]MCK4609549.1 NAD(P)/FAD-dependent oxidoreductase [Candidatus Heimdallarchaeota archaeon]